MFIELQPSRRHGAPTSHDAAHQLAAIRSIVATTYASMPAGSTNAGPNTPPTASMRVLFDDEALEARLLWAKALVGDTQKLVLQQLSRAQRLGRQRRLGAPPDASAFDSLEADFPHCSAAVALMRRRAALARCSPTPSLHLPPLLLTGPPGAGKTAFAKRAAEMMQVPCGEIDMSSLRTTFTVVGLDVGYEQGRAGLIWDLLQNECISPVIVLDELDKAFSNGRGGDAAGFLYSLLEPVTARRFIDAAIGLAIDASHISWIATCNRVDGVDAAIASRFSIIEVDQPTPAQMPAIVASIHRDLLSRADWGGWFAQPLPSDATARLALLAPREVRIAIEEMYAAAAMAGRRAVIPADVPESRTSTGTRRPIGFIQDGMTTRTPR